LLSISCSAFKALLHYHFVFGGDGCFSLEIDHEHYQGENKPDKNACRRQVLSYGPATAQERVARNSFGERRLLILEGLLQLIDCVSSVLLGLPDIVLQPGQGLTLLDDDLVQVLKDVLDPAYALGDVFDLLGSLVQSILEPADLLRL